MKAIYKRYVIWSKSIVDIKVSNTEKLKNNLEECMKVGPPTLSINIFLDFRDVGYVAQLSCIFLSFFWFLSIWHLNIHNWSRPYNISLVNCFHDILVRSIMEICLFKPYLFTFKWIAGKVGSHVLHSLSQVLTSCSM